MSMIQVNPSTGALTAGADGKILSRYYWVYSAETCRDVDPPSAPDSDWVVQGCLQSGRYPFAKFSMLSDGCSVPPLYLSLSGTYEGEEILCHPRYKRGGCSSSMVGAFAVPYNEGWKIECGYETLLFVTETESAAAFSHVTSVTGEVQLFRYSPMPYEEEIFCGLNPPPGRYLFKGSFPWPTYYSELWGMYLYQCVPSLNDFNSSVHEWRCENTEGAECPDWETLRVWANTLLCVDADINLHVVADLTMENAWGSCRLIGVASGLSIDDDTCLPHGTVVVPFYNEYDEYAGSLTYTIETKLCSEA